MKIIKLDLKNNEAKVRVENLDDLWILSRILGEGDLVSGQTTRAVKKTEEQEGERRKLFVKLETKKIEFQKHVDILRILGIIKECSNPDIPLGSHHTLAISLGDVISISKQFSQWQIQRLHDAEASAKRPKVILCAADYGEATIALVKEFGVDYITDVTKSIPGKKKEAIKQYEEGRADFLEELAKTLLDVAKSIHINKIVIGGVGFFSENFEKILPKFPELKKMVSTVKISTHQKAGINEMIKRGAVEQIVKGSRIDEETKLVEKFFENVSKEGLATYGIKEVQKAIEYGAVETLMVSDSYIQELKDKGKFDELDRIMQAAEKLKAKVIIISDEHEAGERFAKMQIAVILRFKV